MARQLEDCECSPPYISGIYLSGPSTVPRDIIDFDYSFGYNCKKLFNLVLITEDVLVFSSGNYIHYYHISTGEMEFRRSAGGGGIGFILKNPNPEYNYLTICENGRSPLVLIYKYPGNEVISILEDGATRSFTCANYRPDGELLVTQSGEPEYMITIWKWKDAKIILRCQSYQNDVLNVIFSPFNPILLTTSGLGHIKFWKMARTFTGLKLQGDLGRFGKTEITDIYSIYMLPDEKVISGCEWGNFFLWDAGLIKLEVCRKNRRTCHNGPITYMNMDDGELMTASTDGYVRIWFWETVELADPPDDDRFVEIEPIYEFRIGDKTRQCEIRHLVKEKPQDPEDCAYYAQDGSGGIWKCWLDKNNVPETPRLLFTCHGGEIYSADTSPISSHIATIGAEGRIHFYNYLDKTLQFAKQFAYPATDIIWVPTVLDPTGCLIIVAFEDGVIRRFAVEFDSNLTTVKDIHLIGAVKPHNKAIRQLSLNLEKNILVSASDDCTIFVQQIITEPGDYIQLIPIGFVTLSSIPTALQWSDDYEKILIGSKIGEIFETTLPVEPDNTEITYTLFDVVLKKIRFKSIKSEIRRDIRLREKEKKKEIKKQKKLADLMKLKETNPGMEIDENMIGEDSDEEEEEPPLFYPPVPNPILWLRYTPVNTIWISVAGYDAGYIYEMVFHNDRPERCTMIDDGDDMEIYFCLHIDKYSLFSTQGGFLRINTMNPNNFRDLTDYYLLGTHDNKNSHVSKLCTNQAGNMLFTVGYDGNLFSFKWNGPIVRKQKESPITEYIMPIIIEDIDDITFPSLEEQKIKAEEDKKLKIRNDRKDKIWGIAAGYRLEFKELLKRNIAMAKSQQYTDDELELDRRITEDLRETLEAELQLTRRKLAFDVEKAILGKDKVMDFFISPLENMPFEIKGIGSDTIVKSFRIKRLGNEIEEIKKEIERRLLLLGESTSDDNEDDVSDIDILEAEKSLNISVPSVPEEKFFLGLDPKDVIPKLPPKMQRLLARYRQRKLHQMQRFVDWEKMNHSKPDPNKNHIDDIKAINDAKRSIGDYKLKADAEYEPKSSDNALNKYKELLRAREVLYKKKKDFNTKLYELRDQKKSLCEFIEKKHQELEFVHMYIPKEQKQYLPQLNEIDFTKENPEDSLIEHVKRGTGVEVSNLFKIEKSAEDLSTLSLIKLIPMEDVIIDLDPTEQIRRSILNFHHMESLPDAQEIESIMSSSPTYLDMSDIVKFGATKEQTIWEKEMRYDMIINKIIKQNEIISEVNYRVNVFDNDLLQLGESKLQIEVDSKFLEIYLIALNEELVILKDCEKLENELSAKALSAMLERNNVKSQIDGFVKSIDDIKKFCDRMNDQIKHMMQNFLSNIKGNKFFDFLKRIFKKKYRPPKEVTDDDESESESSSESSSEEENDDKSVESLDMTPIRLDENICPQNCDRKLYDLAFKLRGERHGLEQTIHNQTKLRDEKQKILNDLRKQLAKVETLFIQERRNLTDFRRQKQAVLNKVKALVVLQMDQLQYLKENENINNIPNTLLFGSENVVKLYARVGQLNIETLETKRIHRINIIHITRMNTDCKYMNRQIHLLQEDIHRAMLRKFGCQLDIDYLEEETLRHYIFQMQMSLDEERKAIIAEIALRQKRLASLEKVLNRQNQLGAEKINILTILQEERNILHDVLRSQAKYYSKQSTKVEHDFRHDLQKLKDVERHQKEQIENIEKEIRSLRFKTKLLQVHPNEGYEEIPQPDGTVEILPPDDLLTDDDRLFKNIETIMPMSHQFGPDVFTLDKIKKIVHSFMIKSFNKQAIPEDSLRKYIDKVSKFFGYVAKNFECDDMEKVMDCIVEQFQNIIPKKYLLYVQPQEIKNLFNEIVSVFRYEKIEINVDEVITGIVNNSFEIIENIKTRPLNFTQAVLIEIFKEIIEVLNVGDLKRTQTINKLCESLLERGTFIPKCIDLYNLVHDVLDYAKMNLLDEFTLNPLKEFAETLYKKLQTPIKAEKPLEK